MTKEFKNRQKVIFLFWHYNDYSLTTPKQIIGAGLYRGKILGELGKYSKGDYTIAITEKIKIFWIGPEELKNAADFDIWNGQEPYGGPGIGIIYQNPKFLHNEGKLPKLLLKMKSKLKELNYKHIKVIFEDPEINSSLIV